MLRHRLTMTQVTLRRKVMGMEGVNEGEQGLDHAQGDDVVPALGAVAWARVGVGRTRKLVILLNISTFLDTQREREQSLTNDVSQSPDGLFAHILVGGSGAVAGTRGRRLDDRETQPSQSGSSSTRLWAQLPPTKIPIRNIGEK